MLPEMAVAYTAGMIPNALLTGAHLWLYEKKRRSPATVTLQENLQSLNLFWSESEGQLREWQERAAERDQRKYRRSALILGGFCLFGSWLGFFAQMIVMLSLRFWAVPRLETRLFESVLAKHPLPTDEAKAVLHELQSLN